ncbi:MAG TPA: YHS domain-containing protein [Candidatus Limnocylindria bacterium]
MATAKDPICAMDVDTATPPGGTSVHAGKTYYFCSNGCRKTFEQDPAKYTA